MVAPDPQRIFATADFQRQLARRYASERRLILIGRLAILFAVAALLVLLWSVASRAVYALTETYLLIDIDFGNEAFDPAQPEASDFESLLRTSLRQNFPAATGRSGRRALYALVSDGASFELRDHILARDDPPTGSERLQVLASDHADLYVKGRLANVTRKPGSFAISIVANGEDFEMLPEAGSDFETALVPIRAHLISLASEVRADAERQEAGAKVFSDRIAGLADESERIATSEQVHKRRERGLALHAEADAILLRAGAEDLVVETTPSLPSVLIQLGGGILRATEVSRGRILTKAVSPPARQGVFEAGEWSYLTSPLPEEWRRISDNQIGWLETLRAEDRVRTVFNLRLFTAGNSREAELAGIRGAVVGSFWTMLVTFLIAVPIGVLSALYLEEFAPRNRFTDFIEININNLAAVPSIVFGLLGLAAFIQFFGIPRSVPLVGGMVLALMTLPTVIIASRAAIRAVPSSIRDAALGVGASRMQTVFHHVLPLAVPGILTGTIIGMAQALGETAPLLLIGMVAFIVGTTGGILEPASALPVQIFQWSEFPEAAFANRAAAAILVLIAFLVAMNLVAVLLRRRFERRW